MVRYDGWLKYAKVILLVLSLGWVLIGCSDPKLTIVKREVDKAIAELPQTQSVELIKTIESQWVSGYHEFFGWIKEAENPCYYARTYVIFGTQLPIEAVIAMYTEPLQKLGWLVDDEPPQLLQYKSSRLFTRNEHERLEVTILAEGTDIASSIGYEHLKEQYVTIFNIRIDYMLPSRDQC
jgi:hypothetical protein